MVSLRRLIVLASVVTLVSGQAFAQAPVNLSSVRVRYNSLKNSAKPDGELKAQIDAIDKEIAEATRLGQISQVRRLIAKGTSLLQGRGWSELDDYDQSLVLRTERLFVDSSLPYTVRLEQTYAPSIQLTTGLSARALLRPLLAQAVAPSAAPAAAPESQTLKELADVSRDLRDSPLAIDLDLSSIPDGAYSLDVEVRDGTKMLGSTSLRIALQKGLETRLRSLDAKAASAPEAVQADIRYPADVVRRVNRGAMELGGFDLARELTAAEAVATAASGGKDPFVGRTGDFERHYLFEAAGEIMPYRIFVPKSYNGSKPVPMVMALHGLGGDEDGWMDRYSGRLPELAEKHGYIAVSPLGYRPDGFYGFATALDPATGRKAALSEQEVMQVLARVRQHYKVDDSRIYLMGHSMGAIGTWSLAAKFPDIWAALGMIAGTGNPASMARMRHIPQFVVHGDADPTVSVSGSRNMVEAMKKLNVDHVYIEVPGGNHSDIAVPNLAPMFDFFNSKRKVATTSQ